MNRKRKNYEDEGIDEIDYGKETYTRRERVSFDTSRIKDNGAAVSRDYYQHVSDYILTTDNNYESYLNRVLLFVIIGRISQE